MKPPRGLSMSEIRKNAMDTATGTMRKMRRSVRRAPYPIRKLQQKEIATIRTHAAIGMRFHHAACVYPCEFSTSFMPETTRASGGVGCAAAPGSTEDHSP